MNSIPGEFNTVRVNCLNLTELCMHRRIPAYLRGSLSSLWKGDDPCREEVKGRGKVSMYRVLLNWQPLYPDAQFCNHPNVTNVAPPRFSPTYTVFRSNSSGKKRVCVPCVRRHRTHGTPRTGIYNLDTRDRMRSLGTPAQMCVRVSGATFPQTMSRRRRLDS